jgi:hypothetical protein
MEDKILLFIPMYNCEKQIIRVIEKLSKYNNIDMINEIIFVDNISKDNTLVVVKNNMNLIPIKTTLIQNNENYNLGGSHKVAFKYALENNFNYLVVLHGDDQGDINCINEILKTGIYKQYDCYLGARFHKNSKLIGYSKFRIFGNYVMNFIFSLFVGKKILDLGSGLNIYNTEFFKNNAIYRFEDTLSFNPYLYLFSIYNKNKVEFFPLNWSELDQISNSRVISQGINYLKMILKYFINKDKFFAETYTTRVNYTYKIIQSEQKE